MRSTGSTAAGGPRCQLGNGAVAGAPAAARSGRAGLKPATWRRDCRRCGSAFVARPEPGDVAGGCADGVVLRLEPGVLAEPGDVKSGTWPAGAGREVECGLGHGFADRCDHLCVRGHPPGRDVVGAVLEMPGELDQGYRAAGVLDVAQVEPVAEVRRDEQGGQVQGLAAGGRVEERGRGEERVLVAERAPGAGDPEADDLRAGRLRELLPEELGDLLRPRR